MDKSQACEAMAAKGYKAVLASGAVMIIVSAEDYARPKVHAGIMRDFEAIGYHESRGVMIESGKTV